jgi:hypothetical protein
MGLLVRIGGGLAVAGIVTYVGCCAYKRKSPELTEAIHVAVCAVGLASAAKFMCMIFPDVAALVLANPNKLDCGLNDEDALVMGIAIFATGWVSVKQGVRPFISVFKEQKASH